jgi:hypothetical protein
MRVRFALTCSALAAVAATGLCAGAAQAQPAPHDGSGTVSDPWVPAVNIHTTCQSTTLFGNYTPGQGHSDPIASLPAGTWLTARYVTSDGNSDMALWKDGGVWGFLLQSCVAYY